MRALPCALVGAFVIAGCGGGGDKKASDTTPGGTADPQAKTAAQAYLDGYTAKNPKAICAALSPKIQKQLADNKGTCVKTIKFSMKGQKFPKFIVDVAAATGLQARATIKDSTRQLLLQRISGAWKVVDGGT